MVGARGHLLARPFLMLAVFADRVHVGRPQSDFPQEKGIAVYGMRFRAMWRRPEIVSRGGAE